MNTFLLTPIHHVSIIAHGFVRNTYTTPSELVRYTACKSTKHVFRPNACMHAFAKDAATLYAIWCKETVAFPPRTPTYEGMHAYSIHAHTDVHALTRIHTQTHVPTRTYTQVHTDMYKHSPALSIQSAVPPSAVKGLCSSHTMLHARCETTWRRCCYCMSQIRAPLHSNAR